MGKMSEQPLSLNLLYFSLLERLHSLLGLFWHLLFWQEMRSLEEFERKKQGKKLIQLSQTTKNSISFGIHFAQSFSESNGHILSNKSLSMERTLKGFATEDLKERNIILLASISSLKLYKYY